MGYSIWLEFEQYAPPHRNDTDEDGYCIVIVTYDDGRRKGYNVWTVDYFREAVQEIVSEVKERGYKMLPDVIVSRLDRTHITEVLKQMLPDGDDL